DEHPDATGVHEHARVADVGDLHPAQARATATLAAPPAGERPAGAPPEPSRESLGDPAMGRVVVDVMPKPEILDPQGKAVAGALARLGFTEFAGARQGKRFELEVEGEVTPGVLERAREAALTLLANPVIEEVVRVTADPDADG